MVLRVVNLGESIFHGNTLLFSDISSRLISTKLIYVKIRTKSQCFFMFKLCKAGEIYLLCNCLVLIKSAGL